MHKGRLSFGSTVSTSQSVNRDATDPPNAAPVRITCFLDLSNYGKYDVKLENNDIIELYYPLTKDL